MLTEASGQTRRSMTLCPAGLFWPWIASHWHRGWHLCLPAQWGPSLFFLRVSKKPREMKGKKSKKIFLKYTAARLHEKGVLLEIEDLQASQ